MEYTEIDIKLKKVDPFADILVAKLNEIHFEAYAEDENGVRAYVQTKLLDKNAVKEIISEISDLTELSFTINQIKQENWNANWESNYPPVIHKDYVIRAPFHNSFPEIKHEIIITPKMSFGTG
ncbi:MAG: 50S ribosomal protein L11 methyltransferase, partial [Bacteroidota bacterium]|nr:50S ribosomal protein L11 methyltransferase [Bacteroidota bacterium]